MIIPNISYSNEGGLSVGATLWYGIPGLSADASVSYNFKTESANVSAGGNVGAFRGSLGYDSKGEWRANLSSISFFKQGVVFDPSVGLSYLQELEYTLFALMENAFIDYHKPGLIEAYGQEEWDNFTIKFESIEELGLS